MRVKMIGHACILCETEDLRILMDPWIFGPANFQSWWHLPEVALDPAELPPLDYIYISHLHGDHFHIPTLERLDRRATVLVPRFYHNRMVRRLRQLGFTRVKELPHGKEARLSRSTRACCLQVGNDSLLAVADSSASMLNANDCLQGNNSAITLPLLHALGARYGFDIAFLAFGTAGAYPKCYRFEDPAEGINPWTKERAMLSNFVQGAITVRPQAVVPFAGGFALLAERLIWMNHVKSTPADALEAMRLKDSSLNGFEMNPGDIWDSRAGLVQVHPTVNWCQRLQVIRRMQQVHAVELKQIEAEERRGPADLYGLFQSCLTQNLRSFPFLRQRMNCSVLFDVAGEPGGRWEVDLRRRAGWFRDGDSGDWSMRVTIPSALLAAVLTDPDGWEMLGISYKLDITMKKGTRAKEGLLNRLIYTPSPLWFLRVALAPRFAEFVIRRREEFFQLVQNKLLAPA